MGAHRLQEKALRGVLLLAAGTMSRCLAAIIVFAALTLSCLADTEPGLSAVVSEPEELLSSSHSSEFFDPLDKFLDEDAQAKSTKEDAIKKAEIAAEKLEGEAKKQAGKVTNGLAPTILGSKIELRNLWAFLGIITFLLFFTVLFEFAKEHVQEAVDGTANEPIVTAIFSELTVLGFLALVTFLLGKFGLDHISLMVYGHKDVAEDKAKLGEILEQIHMVIFLVMVIFVFEALGMLYFAQSNAKRWQREESTVLKRAKRREHVAAFKKMKDENMPTCFELATNCSSRAREYHELQAKVQFMLIRQEFIYDEKNYTVDEENPEGRPLNKDFAFSLYLKKIMGHRLAHVVELPVLQWIFLEFVVGFILITTAAADGEWQYVMWTWLVIAWLLLIVVIVFRNKLFDVLYLLSHDDDGAPLLYEKTPSSPTSSPRTTSADADADAGAGASSESGAGSGAGSGATEETPLRTHTGDVGGRKSYPVEIQASLPRFLKEDTRSGDSIVPTFLKGDMKHVIPGSAREKMLNLFWFGQNEIHFQLSLIRFVFLALSVYMSVFVIQIIPSYVVPAYDTASAVLIAITGILPGLLIYTKYIFEAIHLSVLTTSIEQMRNRRMVENVVRHQKEARAVMMLRMVVAMDSDPLTEEERPTHQQMLDMISVSENSMLVEKMDQIFQSIDADGSLSLTVDEIEMVFETFGMQWDKNKIDSMLHNMNIVDDGRGSKDDTISRMEFLTWLVCKEKQAKAMPTEEFAEKCFKMIDKEGKIDEETGKCAGGDGLLTVSEFQQGLKTMGMGGDGFDFNEVAAIVLELDDNDDNQLDIEDFIRWVERHEREDVAANQSDDPSMCETFMGMLCSQ